MTLAHIFISYKHEDSDFAAILKLQLEEAGFEAWLDEERLRAGEDWREGIDKAIREALALIVVMTPEAKESEYVTYEWACAWGAGVPVIPLMLKPTKLHPRLEALQYLDFTNRRARLWDKLIERLDELDKQYFPRTHIPRDIPVSIRKAVEALDSHNPDEREAAIDSLVQTNHPAAIEALAAAVNHPIRDVRVYSAYRLVELTSYDDRRALPGLLDATFITKGGVFGVNYRELHYRAAKGLSLISDANGMPGLVNILCVPYEHPDTYKMVEDALIKIGRPAVDTLIDRLQNVRGDITYRIANVLGEIGDPAAVAGLVKRLGGEGYSIANALEKIGTPEALETVEEWRKQLHSLSMQGLDPTETL